MWLLKISCLISFLVLNISARILSWPNNDGSILKCAPYVSFQIDCNICKCNQYGSDYSCTFNICPENWNNLDDDILVPSYDRNDIPSEDIRKRSINIENKTRRKRDAGDYEDINRELEHQRYLQSRQEIFDKRREKQELAEQLAQLKEQQKEMHQELVYQQALDEIQRQMDEQQLQEDEEQRLRDAEQEQLDKQQALYGVEEEEEQYPDALGLNNNYQYY